MQSLAHREAENFVNILVTIAHFQNSALEASAAAFLADEFDIREELHLDRDRAIALAGFAAATGNIEGKVAGGEAAPLGVRGGCECIAYGIERLQVGRGIGARSAADGGLVHQDNLFDERIALDTV